jgi:hypothetical protein
MELESIYADLLVIADRVGAFDEQAVRGAGYILSLPRYAEARDPPAATRLVSDIVRVIDELPDDPPETRERKAGPGSETRDRPAEAKGRPRQSLRDEARFFFSILGAGDSLPVRMNGEGGKPPGRVTEWRRDALAYRVAGGLALLAAPELGSALETLPDSRPVEPLAFRIDRLALRQRVAARPWVSHVDSVDLDLTLLTDGPHCLSLPWIASRARITRMVPESGPGAPTPTFLRPFSFGAKSLLYFGEGQPAGTRLLLSIEQLHVRRFSLLSALLPEDILRVTCLVNRRMDVLELATENRAGWTGRNRSHDWQLTKRGPLDRTDVVVEELNGPNARVADPEVGARYVLSGRPHRLTTPLA